MSKPDTNQVSEDELRPFISLFQNAAVARDYVFGCMSEDDINELAAHIFFIEPTYKYDISKAPIDNVFSAYRIAVKALIRTENLKLLAQVRERVVGEDLPPDVATDSGIGYSRQQFAINMGKAGQRKALKELEAEL